MKRNVPPAPEGEEQSYSVFRAFWGGSAFETTGKKRSVLEMYKGGDDTTPSDSTAAATAIVKTSESKRTAALLELRKTVMSANHLVYVRTQTPADIQSITDKVLDGVETSVALLEDQKTLALFGKGEVSDEQKQERGELTDQCHDIQVINAISQVGDRLHQAVR